MDVAPTAVIYAVVITVCGFSSQWEQVLSNFGVMRAAGIMLDHSSAHNLIVAAVAEGDSI